MNYHSSDIIAIICANYVKGMAVQEIVSNTEIVVSDDSDECKNICGAFDVKRVKTTDEIYNHCIKKEQILFPVERVTGPKDVVTPTQWGVNMFAFVLWFL